MGSWRTPTSWIKVNGSFTKLGSVSNSAANCGPPPPQTRTSISDGLFSNSNNWDCSCIPDEIDNIVINSNITLDNNFDQQSGLSFQINAGKSLDISTNQILSVQNDLINNGTITGNLRLNGSNIQNPILGFIESLEIDNASGVNLLSDVDILDILYLKSGVLNTNGYKLNLRSTLREQLLLSNQRVL